MRWLVGHPGPNFSVHDVWQGWVDALTDLGEQVAIFNLDSRLSFYGQVMIETGTRDAEGRPECRRALTDDQAVTLAANGLMSACYQWWPDVVLLISAFFTPPVMLDVMRHRGHKVVLLHTEAPYQDAEQLARAEHADLSLVNDRATLDAYRQVGPAEYMPHAYRPSVHCPGPADPDLDCDLAFAGTGFASRIEFLEQMDLSGLVVRLAGNWAQLPAASPLRRYLTHADGECIDNAEAVRLYRSAACGLNLYRREGEPGAAPGWAMGPREVEMAATGLYFLRDRRGEGDEVLPMLPAFDDPAGAADALRWALAHPEQRAEAAAKARAAIADRTFDNNARQLLRLLDR